MNLSTMLKIMLTYYGLALVIFYSAYLSYPYSSNPIFASLLLLAPIYIWHMVGLQKEKLGKEVNGRDKGTVFLWIFVLFLLALSVRVPSALFFGMPYEKTPLIYLIVLTIVLVENTQISAFGFKTENIEKSLFYGFVLFAVLQGTLLLCSNLLVFAFTNQMLTASYTIVPSLFAIPFHTLCVGISEEGLFRGYMQTHLSRFYSSKNAVLVQAAFFGLWHFVWNLSPFDPIGMFQYIAVTFLIGLIFGYFYSKSKNLVPLIFAHGLYNSFLSGIIENQNAVDALQTIGAVGQILTLLLPYAISAVITFLFIKYFVKEI